jgi:hypothetical protein
MPKWNGLRFRIAMNMLQRRIIFLPVFAFLFGLPLATAEEMRSAVEADWIMQETRWGRSADSDESIQDALGRAEKLLAYWNGALTGEDQREHERKLEEMRQRGRDIASMDLPERLAVYRDLRWFARELALADPAIAGQPLLFMKRTRFICQMLHEYMGYFYDYGDVAGGTICVLERPGQSMKTRDLVKGRLPKGNYATLALSYDASAIYFAFAARSEKKPDFYSPERRSFHIYSMGSDGSDLRQLTSGTEDDFDPCPLPDGGLAFMSSRRGGFARCNNSWEPIASYTLHRMDRSGANIRTLSFHETSEWHPSVLNDGRLVFIRWDYVDRSAANFHGLWTSNPDGSAITSLFGNYTMQINACYQPRGIPGSSKLLFIAGAHHADVGGSLVMLEPARARFQPHTGEDCLESIEVLTPEICFPESVGWPKSYFHSPWPLSEISMLAAFSFDPLPGMSSGEGRDTVTGLYYFDRMGNLELLYRDPALSAMYPIPLAARVAPPVVASNLDTDLGEEGEFLLADVNRSFLPFPAGRAIRELRVFQLLPKTAPHTANEPRIGHANAENARMLLGTVPVEQDGSAYFRAPAGKPLYFQAVDDKGLAVQSMRSAVYLQPGERRSCVGCHETPGSTAPVKALLAAGRKASHLTPGPEGTKPFSFPLLVQPVLDAHCVRCHDGKDGPGKSKLALTGDTSKHFSRSYANLRPHLRWYEWGDQSISQIATHPGQVGADASPLTSILEDQNHQAELKWSAEERRKIYLWLDANAPFYGTYGREEQLAQRQGKSVPPPLIQ